MLKNELKVLRTKCDMTQEELAERVGCTRQTIHSIEKNRYSPSLVLAFRIAAALDVSITDLFQYEE